MKTEYTMTMENDQMYYKIEQLNEAITKVERMYSDAVEIWKKWCEENGPKITKFDSKIRFEAHNVDILFRYGFQTFAKVTYYWQHDKLELNYPSFKIKKNAISGDYAEYESKFELKIIETGHRNNFEYNRQTETVYLLDKLVRVYEDYKQLVQVVDNVSKQVEKAWNIYKIGIEGKFDETSV